MSESTHEFRTVKGNVIINSIQGQVPTKNTTDNTKKLLKSRRYNSSMLACFIILLILLSVFDNRPVHYTDVMFDIIYMAVLKNL